MIEQKERFIVPKIAENVYEIKSKFVSMFVYDADEFLICFDARFNENTVRSGFDQLGFDIEDVRHVFLTHTDRDHVGGLRLFKRAELYLSVDEEQMITRKTARFFGTTFNPPIKREYTLLKDGDTIQAGATHIKALSTPGHTPGSMSYVVNNSILFVGDTLTLRNGRVRPFSKLHIRDAMHMDRAAQAQSIRKLAHVPHVSLMLTCHSGFTTEFDRAMAEWV
ncbi:MAG: MBL fold metallo-hydrolase [Halobacteriota archaeon]